MAGAILYINASKSTEVKEPKVILGDVASVFCEDINLCAKIKAIRIFDFTEKTGDRMIISILKLIEQIQTACPGTEVVNLGETTMILEYARTKGNSQKGIQNVKTAVICLVIFFGTAFTIMAFHNDIGIHRLFHGIYRILFGSLPEGVTVLEISYSIGLAAGIILFFNHLGKKKITEDPTPIEVEMRIYEKDVNDALIDKAQREEKILDVH